MCPDQKTVASDHALEKAYFQSVILKQGLEKKKKKSVGKCFLMVP